MTTYTSTKFGKAKLLATYDGGEKIVVDDGLKLFANYLKKRIKNDYQNVIVVDGRTGSGKSNCAVNLALALDKNWKVEENYVYDASDLRRKIANPDANPITLMDEGSLILNSLNSQRNDDKMITMLFDTMRTMHMTTIVCCPNMFKLNKTFREVHVDFRLLCPTVSPIPGYAARGFVHIHSHRSSSWKDSDSYPYIYTALFDKMPRSSEYAYDECKTKSQNRFKKKYLAEGDTE